MIKKILIANRGEIACRVIRTAKRLGIATVAVYSDADAQALHVRQADEAVHIGGNASADSYLRIDAIVDAARKTGADAVHPGFGFLSENAKFAKALHDAGIIFIGPGIKAIEVMGDKIESKKLADAAGVSTVPGSPEAMENADQAFEVASQIGCPVMLKASAGGGGKGMRVANTLDEVRDGFIAAQNEARNAFGDDRVFVEKFIEQPRHIEIQLIADSHGNCIYLAERECSIQRRHQKVIEEAPSSFINEATRKAMGEQAVALAAAVDYQSAGTVEFIVDAQANFFFLEMNTRLQVEHPVTECITGVDLVELMIQVAAGQPLPLSQSDVRINGWSFEARVYAENPDKGFLPSTGRITHYSPPDTRVRNNGAYTRVDTGVDAGGEISMFYDPMIAKLVTWAPSREEAIAHMRNAIDAYRIRGVQSNLPFLAALFAHPALLAGDLTTRFIEDHFPDGFDSHSFEGDAFEALPLVAAWIEWRTRLRDRKIVNAPKVARSSVMAALGQDQESLSNSNRGSDESLSVLQGDSRYDISMNRLVGIDTDWQPGDWLFHGTVDKKVVSIGVERVGNWWRLSQGGSTRDFMVLDPHVADLADYMPEKKTKDMSRFLLSPMPGLLMKILVREGDKVSAGQDLAIIEAMKMENTLTASVGGTVSKIVAATGDSLAVDAVIIEFE
ncbi:acetyl-CoA carboxylase biotin carboxylase subunit [Granulosicoccus antarcticus]|uniref:acetyl-CoA carboxylase biotin carboxylase subunit n=1 Tax=Granulosicoccus antarcticus TaxID=437505 RepID=UPI000B5A32F2|nr:acetyl/propionyl/methylcrotonyl-CoA carboxylase subunit alpha [Granulosicoccus antarcticus]